MTDRKYYPQDSLGIGLDRQLKPREPGVEKPTVAPAHTRLIREKVRANGVKTVAEELAVLVLGHDPTGRGRILSRHYYPHL